MERAVVPRIAFFTLTAGMMVAGQNALAHNSFTSSVVAENTRVYNNMVIGKGCGHDSPRKPVIANSIVFPDGTDSIIKIGDAVQPEATVDQYINWGGQISHIPSKDIFQQQAVNFGRGGIDGANAVGSHSWEGELPGDGSVGLVPLRINAASINPESCASSVTFRAAVADICELVKKEDIGEENVNLWVPAIGSDFDGDPSTHAYNGAVNYKITRNLDENPLPRSCKRTGFDVVIEPSADQVNHDLPIPNVWPK
jgi:hypothetical protein